MAFFLFRILSRIWPRALHLLDDNPHVRVRWTQPTLSLLCLFPSTCRVYDNFHKDGWVKREATIVRPKNLCCWWSSARHKVHALVYAGTKEKREKKYHDETLMSTLVFPWIRNSQEGEVSRSHRGHHEEKPDPQRHRAQLSFAHRWARKNNFVFPVYQCEMFSLTSKQSS